MEEIINRLLRERLKDYKVPAAIIQSILTEIMTAIKKANPMAAEKKPYGASVMTAEASMAADEERKTKKSIRTAAPKIV